MPSLRQDNQVRDQLIADLKTHACLTEERTEIFKHVVLTSSYLEQYCKDGEIAPVGQKYYRPDGVEFTFRDVPVRALIQNIQAHVWGYVLPRNRQTEVYNKILANVPSRYHRKWTSEGPPPNPNKKPTTEFSRCKMPHRSRKSNTELIDDLASAAGLSPGTALLIQGQITWCDGSAGAKICSWSPASGKVSGGRLGRDHTLEDVPNCYVRDRIMDYINSELPAEKRQAARRAVFSDLAEADIDSYSALIAKKMDDVVESPIDSPARTTVKEAEETAHQTVSQRHHHLITRLGELRNIERQEEILHSIQDDIDLTAGASIASRELDYPAPMSRSVVKPNSESLPVEHGIQIEIDIRHDCDQVRAMIKCFVTTGEWTLDQFRLALGAVTRPQMKAFLGLAGPKNGARAKVFQLCWEFFHRREKLGLPLIGAEPQKDENLLRQRGSKRRRMPADAGSRGGKRLRRSRVGTA